LLAKGIAVREVLTLMMMVFDSVQNIAGHINSGLFVLSCSASSCKNTEGIYDARDVSQDCQEETYPELHLPKKKSQQL
jgi:hypothetical protein